MAKDAGYFMKTIILSVFTLFVCVGVSGCAVDPIDWKPVAGWETLDTKHRAESIDYCEENENFNRCMYSRSYVFSQNGSVMPLDKIEPGQKEISVTELKQ